MLKYWSIKKYGKKLQKTLEKRYGGKSFYSPKEVRTTVYKCNFSPTYLPLGYILYIESKDLSKTIAMEFPEIDPVKYKEDILTFLDKKSYQGSILQLAIVSPSA